MRSIRARSWLVGSLAIGLLCTVLIACESPQAALSDVSPSLLDEPLIGSCSLLSQENSLNEEIIWALISAESQYVVSQEIDKLMNLWANDAQVTDAGNTPDDLSDDQSWLGADAIRYRYIRNVFPSAPGSAQPVDLIISVIGNDALVLATTRIGDEEATAGDRWELVKQGDCWLIKALTFNLET